MNYITLIFLNIFVKLLNISFIFLVSFVGSLDFELKMRTQKCTRRRGKGLFHGCSEFNSRRNANQTFRPATHTKLKWFQQTRYFSTINPKWLQMMQLIAKTIVLLLDTPTLFSKAFPFFCFTWTTVELCYSSARNFMQLIPFSSLFHRFFFIVFGS